MEYSSYARLYDGAMAYPGYPLERDFPRAEYDLRLGRARALMAADQLDALVITSGAIGHWFTSALEPHEWHDQCPARSAWYILTPSADYLYMTPTMAGEHFNTARRSTWVGEIRAIVERPVWPRVENWALEQIPEIFGDLGLRRCRLGFELGDCMTLGLSVNDFLRLRELLPRASFVDASALLRRLMSVHTPEEIERVRRACQAGVWIYDQVPAHLGPGMREGEFLGRLAGAFASQFGAGYAYDPAGAWDVRNTGAGDSNMFHRAITERVFRVGDTVARATSGASYRGYGGDVDRLWYIGRPPDAVLRWYQAAWSCNRAMAEMIKPGNRCSDIYAAYARMEQGLGLPPRLVGRAGHGLRNSGGLSVHPQNHTVLEPGMIISVEPTFANEYGYFDLEDQYLVTETGSEILHEPAPERLPVIAA